MINVYDVYVPNNGFTIDKRLARNIKEREFGEMLLSLAIAHITKPC